MVFVTAFAASIVMATVLLLISGERSMSAIGAELLNVLSLQSTTGFTTSSLPGPLPLFVLMIALMAVGGQTGSTAGGMKIDRIRILIGAVAFTLRRLVSPPSAVHYLKLDEEIVDQDRVLFAVALVVTYLMSALLLWIAFSMYGLPAAASLFDIVSALSTVGAGTGVIGPDLPESLKLLTVCAMLLGRLEFFGLLVLVLPVIWTRRD
jgi:trk system potassium uptake protein TrkH